MSESNASKPVNRDSGWRASPSPSVCSSVGARILAGGAAAVIEIDILGQAVRVSPTAVGKLRDLAAAEAGRSNSARDLSLVLDRALRTGTIVALHRGEARALLKFLDREAADPELAALAAAIHPNQRPPR